MIHKCDLAGEYSLAGCRVKRQPRATRQPASILPVLPLHVRGAVTGGSLYHRRRAASLRRRCPTSHRGMQPAGEYSLANLLLLLIQPAGEYSSANLLLLLTRLGSTPRPICYYYLLSRLGSTPRPPTCITTYSAGWGVLLGQFATTT